MEIQHNNQSEKGSFKALENNKEIGTLNYRWKGDNIISVDHTEVIPEFEGKGIAKELLMEAVEFARQKSLKIQPNCSYAKRVFEKSSEIQDVLYEE